MSQLEKSKDAVTVANIRAAYVEAQTAYLTESDSGTKVKFDKDNNKVTVSGVIAKGSQDGLSDLEKELPFDDTSKTALKTSMGKDANGNTGYTLTFTYTDGELTSVTAA